VHPLCGQGDEDFKTISVEEFRAMQPELRDRAKAPELVLSAFRSGRLELVRECFAGYFTRLYLMGQKFLVGGGYVTVERGEIDADHEFIGHVVLTLTREPWLYDKPISGSRGSPQLPMMLMGLMDEFFQEGFIDRRDLEAYRLFIDPKSRMKIADVFERALGGELFEGTLAEVVKAEMERPPADTPPRNEGVGGNSEGGGAPAVDPPTADESELAASGRPPVGWWIFGGIACIGVLLAARFLRAP